MPTILPATRDLVLSAMDFLKTLGTGEPDGNRRMQEWARGRASEWGRHTIQASKLSKGGCGHEYLVDVSVTEDADAEDKNDPFGYHALSFAMEVEWSPSRYDRRYDFCKLADIKARRKLFIGACHVNAWKSFDSELRAMQSFLNAHDLVHETEEFGVIICCYGQDQQAGGWILRKNREREPVQMNI